MKSCLIPECTNPVEGRTELCASHAFEARKGERRLLKETAKAVTKMAQAWSNKTIPKKPISKTSAKRKDKLKEYTPLRKQYLLDHPNCEIKLIGCEGRAVEIHHVSTSDRDFLNTKTWKGSCRHCHNFVERVLSAADRRKRGLLI